MSGTIISCDNVIYSTADEGINFREFTTDECNHYNSKGSLAVSTAESGNDSKVNTFTAFVVLSLVMLVLLLGAVGACIAFALEIHELKSETASIQTSMQQGAGSESMVNQIARNLSLSYLSLQDKIESINASLHLQAWEAFINKIQS